MKYWICCPFQTSFCVESEDERFLTNLKLKYGRYCEAQGAKECPCFYVTREPDGERYRIEWNEEVVHVESPIVYLAREIATCRQFYPHVLALHGAAVEHAGGAYVFLAATTSGKTTLTTFLTQKGFCYLTDDCVLIDRETLEVYPYTTPIHLRAGGVEVLRQSKSCPTSLEHIQDPGFERWTFTPTNCVEKPSPLKQIFFLQRTENENGVISLNTNEIFSRLLKSPIIEYPVTAEYLKIISRLAAAGAYELRYKDMSFAEEVLRNGHF